MCATEVRVGSEKIQFENLVLLFSSQSIVFVFMT